MKDPPTLSERSSVLESSSIPLQILIMYINIDHNVLHYYIINHNHNNYTPTGGTARGPSMCGICFLETGGGSWGSWHVLAFHLFLVCFGQDYVNLATISHVLVKNMSDIFFLVTALIHSSHLRPFFSAGLICYLFIICPFIMVKNKNKHIISEC